MAAEGVAIYDSIPVPQATPSPRLVRQETIRYSIPWAYYDGALDINGRCGAGLIIHFSKEKIVKASVGLGQGSNNFAELKALHLLLCWLVLRNVQGVQIFRDSMNTVRWSNGSQLCRNFILFPLLREATRLKYLFTEIFLSHIFRERNSEADRLSKEGVDQDMGSWTILEEENGLVRPLEQPIFD